MHDGQHHALAGATVTGLWTGNVTDTCVTNQNGKCSVIQRYARKKTSVLFAVTNLQSTGDTYQSSSNHDPDADSNGTSISVSRP